MLYLAHFAGNEGHMGDDVVLVGLFDCQSEQDAINQMFDSLPNACKYAKHDIKVSPVGSSMVIYRKSND